MLPADQRLDGADVRRMQRDLRLVIQAQLVAFHGAPQLAEQRQVFLLAGVVVRIVDARSRSCCAWRRTWRCRRCAPASARRGRVPGSARCRCWCRRRAADPRTGSAPRARRVSRARPAEQSVSRGVLEQDGEFVAAEACNALGAGSPCASSRRLTSRSTWSPTPCPSVSLTYLKRSRSIISMVSRKSCRARPRSIALREFVGEARAVGEIGQRILVGQLEDAAPRAPRYRRACG